MHGYFKRQHNENTDQRPITFVQLHQTRCNLKAQRNFLSNKILFKNVSPILTEELRDNLKLSSVPCHNKNCE